MTYTPTIGLEIHAEVKTESKLFCGCRNDPHESEPNAYVCPVCMGYPGAMPYIQREAIEKVLRLGVALGGELASYTQFDRKHYFYPDIPKGFQISQYEYPLVKNAALCGVDITRIHLEEDTAKSTPSPDTDHIFLDFNRSGVPLLELVTEPTIHTAQDAVAFAQEFQRILSLLEVSGARMERGEMRVEVNISVSDGDALGTKVEIKNLNSFKVVEKAIAYEMKRQEELLSQGGVVVQETRGYSDVKGETYSQRLKETAHEYRYAPEPDLPALDISLVPEWHSDVLKKSIPELPQEARARYIQLGVSEEQAYTLTAVKKRQDFFDSVVAMLGESAVLQTVSLVANYITSDIVSVEQKQEGDVYRHLTAETFLSLIDLIVQKKLSSRGAKDVLAVMIQAGGDPNEIAEKKKLFQQSDENALRRIVEEVIEKNPDAVSDFKKGKESALKFFIGQVMKETKGSANPEVTETVLGDILKY